MVQIRIEFNCLCWAEHFVRTKWFCSVEYEAEFECFSFFFFEANGDQIPNTS